ncbi:MAG: hypothetical protein HC820_05110 [Hydrococcus sp. RM1_1_31]|nr:hypothetical protein [Hydrococcus sp. RM1_1_31]
MTTETNETNGNNSQNWDRIAALAGFQENLKGENLEIRIDTDTDNEPPLLPSDEIDNSDRVSKLSFANPTRRTGLMLGGAVAIACVGWLAMSLGNKQPKEQPSPDEQETNSQEAQSEKNEEVGKLKTDLALSKQAQQLSQFAQQPPPPKTKPEPPRSVRPQIPPRPQIVRVPVSQPVRQLPRRQVYPRPIPRPVSPPVQRPVQSARQIDPAQAWEQAAALGSYGLANYQQESQQQPNQVSANVPVDEIPPSSDSGYQEAYYQQPPTESQIVSDGYYPNESEALATNDNSYSRRFPASTASYTSADEGRYFQPRTSQIKRTNKFSPKYSSSYQTAYSSRVESQENRQSEPSYSSNDFFSQANYYEEELPILTERAYSVKSISPGSVQGTLADSFVWDNSQIYSSRQSAIQLEEPLISREGEVIAPASSLLIVSFSPSRGGGIVQLVAESLVVERPDGSWQEIPLEPDAISITAEDGKPLMASQVDDDDEDTDVGGLIFDTLKTAATFATSSDNSYQDMYRYNQLEQLYDRHFQGENENRFYERASARTNAWMLEAGTELEISVNRPIEIRE